MVANAVLRRPVSEEVGTALIEAVGRALHRKRAHDPCQDDLLQDIVLWLLLRRHSLREFPPGVPLVSLLVSRFLRTKNRKRYYPTRLEPVEALAVLTQTARGDTGLSGVEERSWAGSLPPTAGRLVRLVLQGFTWMEACDELHVPNGSRSFLRAQVRTRFWRVPRSQSGRAPRGSRPVLRAGP
jgi:hypothetical protein